MPCPPMQTARIVGYLTQGPHVMCNCVCLQDLKSPLTVQAGERGKVVLSMKLPHGKTEECTLHDVLYVPDLAFNLLSVPAAR